MQRKKFFNNNKSCAGNILDFGIYYDWRRQLLNYESIDLEKNAVGTHWLKCQIRFRSKQPGK